jgi:hypothetical protein
VAKNLLTVHFNVSISVVLCLSAFCNEPIPYQNREPGLVANLDHLSRCDLFQVELHGRFLEVAGPGWIFPAANAGRPAISSPRITAAVGKGTR